jgi:hypothetical protein
MAVAGDGPVSLSWSPASGATSYNVQRALGGGPFAVVASSIPAASYVDEERTNGSTYRYTVSGSNSGGEGPTTAAVSATPPAPTVWSNQDIGAVGAPGSGSQSGNTYTVSGGGADIWDTADAFHFMFRAVSGDATLTARVVSLQAVEVWTKATVMMRDGLAPNARNVALPPSPTDANGYRLQARIATGDVPTTDRTVTGTTPVWLRVVRRGDSFTGFRSSNGSNWTQVGTTKTISMPSSIQLGLAVTSHNTAVAATAVFDNVSVTTP